jgi:hypothetical protein
VGVARRTVAACDGIAEYILGMSQERLQRRNRGDGHYLRQLVDYPEQFGTSQAEFDPPACFVYGPVGRNERCRTLSPQKRAGASAQGGGNQDCCIDH